VWNTHENNFWESESFGRSRRRVQCVTKQRNSWKSCSKVVYNILMQPHSKLWGIRLFFHFSLQSSLVNLHVSKQRLLSFHVFSLFMASIAVKRVVSSFEYQPLRYQILCRFTNWKLQQHHRHQRTMCRCPQTLLENLAQVTLLTPSLMKGTIPEDNNHFCGNLKSHTLIHIPDFTNKAFFWNLLSERSLKIGLISFIISKVKTTFMDIHSCRSCHS
jgi:hypothetical protein